MVWRFSLVEKCVIGFLAFLCGGFALVNLIFPLPIIFPREEKPLYLILLFTCVSAPLFCWLTFVLVQAASKTRVVLDEDGIEISLPNSQKMPNSIVTRRVSWSDVSAIYVKSGERSLSFFIFDGQREIAIPLNLSGPASLREEIQRRTRLEMTERKFAPTNAQTGLEFNTAQIVRAKKAMAAMCWLLYALTWGTLLFAGAQYSQFYSPEMWLAVVVCVFVWLGLTMYLATTTILEIRLWHRFKNQRWRFDAHGISCETSGERRFLAMENIESLERIGARILRARGGDSVLEWPKISVYPAREEEFLVEQLARADREIAWREIPKNAALNSSP